MPSDLLHSAREQAERSDLNVRAAALFHIARAETADDPVRARATFQQALDACRQVPGREGEWLLEQAQSFAAAISPVILRDMPAVTGHPHRFHSDKLARIMIEHGHLDSALDYILRHSDAATFPYGALSHLLPALPDDDRRRAAFRAAIAAWLAAPRDPFAHQFITTFGRHWELLPPEEAREAVQAIVRSVLAEVDWSAHATYDPERSVTITSGREHTLFEVLHILRRLDPPLAVSLIAQHPQLAAATRRFPNGFETVFEEARRRQRETPASALAGGGFGMVGNPRDFPYMHSLLQAARDGDFDAPLPHALEQYREDSNPETPNRAPREFWPSTFRFRQVLYSAGKSLGHAAIPLLERIPDSDLRLFAQIELAAALAGLPELRGIQRRQRMRDAPLGQPFAGVRCPKCQWQPTREHQWACKCGHHWNTFLTRARCPACQYQWEVTQCLRCGESSPHGEWYTGGV